MILRSSEPAYRGSKHSLYYVRRLLGLNLTPTDGEQAFRGSEHSL